MKRYKYVRIILHDNGYSDGIPSDLTLVDIDADGYLIYNDENNNIVKAKYDTTSPIGVDSDSEGITATTSISIATGETYQLEVLNEDGLNVTNECTFTPSGGEITVSSTGLVTGVSNGTPTIDVDHPDIVASPAATVSVTVS